MLYAKVIVDISAESVDKLFTYELNIDAVVGQRVLVPFGNRTLEGFILEITDERPDFDKQIKSVIKTLEDYAAFDSQQLELAQWIRRAYHCTMAQALRLMIPAQLRGMRIKEKFVRTVSLKSGVDAQSTLNAMISKNGKVRSVKQYDIVKLLSNSNIDIAVSDLNEVITNASSALRTLINNNIVEEHTHAVYRRPAGVEPLQDVKMSLTDEQNNAVNAITKGFDVGEGVFLLHGITGSGKTEVYLQAIDRALLQGRSAIVLVPEISLTPQTVSRFKSRFGGRVAVLHSRLSPGERFDEWRRIRKGEVNVVVGARSAVFAPVDNLGIIVIDEEHESSYSSEKSPRYSAGEIAKKRCTLSHAVLVMGSATPLITTYFNAKRGRYTLLELNKRVNSMPLPYVNIVDMRAEFLGGNNGVFSELLRQRLSECFDKGEQAILFVNRRGYSSYITCRACGYVFECDSCDVSMTYHKLENRLKCHYCGAQRTVPKLCPGCSRPYLKYVGVGTQQVEEAFTSAFPNARYLRMDADSTRGKDAHYHILSQFAAGEASVLIGTQMIAKGLDFPNVTMVGVVFADSMLNIPDFRNTERAFSLLTQVAGRAGRADKVGHVIIQTNTPEHPVIQLAAKHDYKSFYEVAIAERLSALYPPYSLFVRVLFLGDDEEQLIAETQSYADGIYSALTAELEAIGGNMSEVLFIYAMPAPITRISGKYRNHVLMKLARTKHTSALINRIYLFSDENPKPHMFSIEVNPSDMM